MENPGWEFRTILSDINSGGPEKETAASIYGNLLLFLDQ